MPPTTSYSLGDVVLVPFPFTDQTGLKKRPAIVVSSQAYHQRRRDLIIMAVSSQVRPTPDFGEFTVKDWKKAGVEPAHRKAIEAPRGRRGDGPLEAPFMIEHLDPEHRHPILKPIAYLGLPPHRRRTLRQVPGFVRLPLPGADRRP